VDDGAWQALLVQCWHASQSASVVHALFRHWLPTVFAELESIQHV
jgi:hypothetical protein